MNAVEIVLPEGREPETPELRPRDRDSRGASS